MPIQSRKFERRGNSPGAGKPKLCACKDKTQEIIEILHIIENNSKNSEYFIKKIPNTLKKIAHKKHRESFFKWLKRIKALQKNHKNLYALIDHKIRNIEQIAQKRFSC